MNAWKLRKKIIVGILFVVFVVTGFVGQTTFGQSLLTFIGVTASQKVVTATPVLTVTSDSKLVSPLPVGVTSDINSNSQPKVTVTRSKAVTPKPSVTIRVSPSLSPLPTATPVGKININTAGKDQLMTLWGIGEVKAQAIIDYRQKSGLFKTIDQIKDVTGIGDKTFEKIKDQITV